MKVGSRMENRDELMSLLQKATDIPFHLYNLKSGVLLSENSSGNVDLAMHLLEEFQKAGCSQNKPLVIDMDELFYVAMLEFSEFGYLILGPVCPARYEREKLQSLFRGYDAGVREFMVDLLLHGPLVTRQNLIGTVCLSARIVDDAPLEAKDIVLICRKADGTEIEQQIVTVSSDALEQEWYHLPKKYEDRLVEAIQNGDRIGMQMCLKYPQNQGHIGVMSKNETRQLKYTFVTAATLYCRAVVEAGVDPELAYSTSDAYCQKMDTMTDRKEIFGLLEAMLNTYVTYVEERQAAFDSSSTAIRSAKDYISKHLMSEIDPDEMAESCGLSKRWLAKKFITETGMSISEYIQKCKLKQAEHFLLYTDFSISEIGNLLGYATQSYFTEKFRKEYGITPKKYRDIHG